MATIKEKLAAFERDLRDAERQLSRRDPVLRPFIKQHGPCQISPHSNHFETLTGAIIAQQLSTKVAETIGGRVKDLYKPARAVRPEHILGTPDEVLRATGMSYGKVSFIKDLAARTTDGRLKLSRMPGMPDDEIIEMLTEVKGIGVWTAHMFLIFSLGRLDILPVGDLGIRKAIQTAFDLADLPNPEQIEAIALERRWRPYCSVASWYLWRSLA